MVPWLALVGMIAGKKKQEQEKAEFERQREIQAETTRMSPWTGMKAAAPIAPKGKFANMFSGTMAGLGSQQSMGGMFGGGGAAPAANESSWENMQMDNDMNKFALVDEDDPLKKFQKQRQQYYGYNQQPTFSGWNFQ